MNVVVSKICNEDYAEWLPLWNGNNQGHENEEVTKVTWSRLIDPEYQVFGLVSRVDNKMAGLLHYILHPVTGHIDPVCYMQDVYVDPEFRRKGIGRTMIEHLIIEGQKNKWARMYWLAEEDNIEAQSLYKNLGVKLNFSLHVMPLQVI
jgi:ribosomal protein S18 acetylase RimI-like enzyme